MLTFIWGKFIFCVMLVYFFWVGGCSRSIDLLNLVIFHSNQSDPVLNSMTWAEVKCEG